MGFIYIKSSNFTIELFDGVNNMIKIQNYNYTYLNGTIKPDDQYAINYQLYDWNITWNNNKIMKVESNRLSNIGRSIQR